MSNPLESLRSAGLHSVGQLDRSFILDIVSRAARFKAEPRPEPSLTGVEIAMLFLENSTRTRISFEVAAARLGARAFNFDADASSLAKGETLKDTVETIASFGCDAMVVRSPSAGAPQLISGWIGRPVINAGDGAHQHPTQALADVFTIAEAHESRGDFGRLRVGIIGDIVNSRVARSLIDAFEILGSEVVLIGPKTLMPSLGNDAIVSTSDNLDDHLATLDIVYLLRVQRERIDQGLIPSIGEYVSRFALSRERFTRLRPSALVMHPGPVFPGMEVDSMVADGTSSVIRRQAANGVFVRMALLETVLGGLVK